MQLIVLFGRAASGKDTISALVEKYYGVRLFNADQYISPAYKELIQQGINPSPEARDEECMRYIKLTQSFMRNQPILVNWVFFYERQRLLWKQHFPDTTFVYVNTSLDVIKKRLLACPRAKHFASTEYVLRSGESFEEPQLPHFTIDNNGSHAILIKNIHLVFSSLLSTPVYTLSA